MSRLRLIFRGFVYHWRMHMGLTVGAALVGAVLTGALVVGDCVDFSLRSIATSRLGHVAYAMDWPNRLFAEGLAERFAGQSPSLETAALLHLRGTVALPPERNVRAQVNRAHVYGIDERFASFALARNDSAPTFGPQEAAINEKTAEALGVKPGDDLVLRIGRYGAMPLDAPLSSRTQDFVSSSLVTVKAILNSGQLGDFSLDANQTIPCNVFVDRAWLQTLADLERQANLLLADDAADGTDRSDPTDLWRNAMKNAWELEDIGLHLRTDVPDLLQLESNRVFLDDGVVEAALQYRGAVATLTYLVNEIALGARKTPYSFVEAGSEVPENLRDDEVVVNQWLADQLEARPGDRIDVAYYRLLPMNAFEEERHSFTLGAVLPMDALAVERALAPKFPGLSDVENCRDWNVGMPMDEALLRDAPNEAYWRAYGQTPKLFATLETGQALWANRFGSVTAVRFPATQGGDAAIRQWLRDRVDPDRVGLMFRPVRQIALDAVSESLDFGGLFLGMSFFLIVAALILLGLLYVFGVQQRASEMGLVLALGSTPGAVRRDLLLEACPAALAGALLGAPAGLLYAQALLFGLTRFWPGAVANTRIAFHAEPASIVTGIGIVFACALGIAALAAGRATRRSPRDLLTRDFASATPARASASPREYTVTQGGMDKRGRAGTQIDIGGHPQRRQTSLGKPSKNFPSYPWHPLLAGSTLCALAALGTIAYVLAVKPDDLTEPFFGAGSMLLLAGLGYYGVLLGHLARRPSFREPRLWKVALTNLARRRGRSLSVAGLTACGCFLVIAVSSMRQNVALNAGDRASGTGGFAIYAETAFPMLEAPSQLLESLDAGAVPFRLRDGDDAGCLNLNHAQVPRLAGVDTRALAALHAFLPAKGGEDLWALLDAELPGGAIPALVGDSDTAMWGLRKKTGDILAYHDESGREVPVKLVGRLPMRLSVFQGTVLISQASFTRLFPSEAGFRGLLIDAPESREREVAARLNADLDRYGIDAVPSVQRLREFYAVESTYLAMFLVLGCLGLLLGGAGTGIVVLRNLDERRREIAILHAVGYAPRTVFGLLTAEHLALAFAGIALGVGAGCASMLPLVVLSRTVMSPVAMGAAIFGVSAVYATAAIAGVGLGLPRNPLEDLRNE